MSTFEPEWVMRLARVESPLAEHPLVERPQAERPQAEARVQPDTASETHTPSCLRQALRQYSRYVIGLLGRLGVASADIEDVAQEVYLAIHAQLPSFEARHSFKTWLCGICRHKAADYRRKRARRQALASTRPAEVLPESECPQGRLLEHEAKEALRRVVERLPDEQLEVFVLHAVEDLPMKDVAMLLGCPLDTAYTRYRVAVQRVTALCRRAELTGGKP